MQFTPFFYQYEAILDHRQIKPKNIYNIDESGLQMGETGREMIISDASNPSNSTSVKEPDSERWNTSLKCISALRKAINPLMIFTGQNVWTSWLPRQLKADEWKN